MREEKEGHGLQLQNEDDLAVVTAGSAAHALMLRPLTPCSVPARPSQPPPPPMPPAAPPLPHQSGGRFAGGLMSGDMPSVGDANVARPRNSSEVRESRLVSAESAQDDVYE